MPYFVRKISGVKWMPEEDIGDNPFDISSDAITVDLKTHTNTLSVWQINDENSIEDAVLAIVSGFEKIQTIDVVWIEREEIDRKGIEFIESPGKTPIKHLINTHLDLSSLNYYHLGLVVESIIDTIQCQRWRKYTKSEIQKLLLKAISNGSVDVNDFNEKIRPELIKLLESSSRLK